MAPMPLSFKIECRNQCSSAPGYSAFGALHFAGGLKGLLTAEMQNLGNRVIFLAILGCSELQARCRLHSSLRYLSISTALVILKPTFCVSFQYFPTEGIASGKLF